MLNKKWMVFGVLAVMISIVLFPKVMAIGNNPTLTIGEKTAYSGETVDVPITLAFGGDVESVEYVITYDAEALTLDNVSEDGIFPIFNSDPSTPGSVRITQSGAIDDVNGVIATLEFAVNTSAQAGNYAILAEGELYTDDSGQHAMDSTIKGDIEVLGVYFDDLVGRLFALKENSPEALNSLADLMVLSRNLSDNEGVDNTISALINALGKDDVYDDIMSSIWEIADLYDGSVSALANAVNNGNVQAFKGSFSAEDIAIISNNPFGLDALDMRMPKLDLLLDYLNLTKEEGNIGGVSSVVFSLEQNTLSVNDLTDIYDMIVFLGGEIKTFPGISDFESGLNQFVSYYNNDASFSDQQNLIDFLEEHQLVNNDTVYLDDLMARLFDLDVASRDSLADLMVLGKNIDDIDGIKSAINTLVGILGKDGNYDDDMNAIWELPTYYIGTDTELRTAVVNGDLDAFMGKITEDMESIGFYSFGYQAFEARELKLDLVLSWLNTAKETGELFGKSTFAFNLSQSQLAVRDISDMYAKMAEDPGVSLIIGELPALTNIEDGFAELATHYNSTTAGDQLQILNFLTDHQLVYRDTTAPVITLVGDAVVTVEVNTSYADEGATALDATDGDMTAEIDVDNPVDISEVDTYTITYMVTDSDNNTATATRTVHVVDTTAPVITLEGGTVTVEVEANLQSPTTWENEEPGYSVLDNNDTQINVSVDTSALDLTTIGTYTITYNAADVAGNDATAVTRTVNVVDTFAPVLTCDDSLVMIEKDEAFTAPSCTALDAYDGTVSVTLSGSVNSAVSGTYTLTYRAEDSSGNSATTTKTVVVDPGKPFIVLEGDDVLTFEVDKTAGAYVDAGATGYYNGATATLAPDQNTVDLTTVGTYTLMFMYAPDGDHEADDVYRTVRVVDTTAPVITLIGDSGIELTVGSAYVELNATVSDNYDDDKTATIEGNVNTAVSGTYTLTYTAYDNAGNAAVPVVRTVIVKDTNAPVITLTGSSSVKISVGMAYSDAGAIALDQEDGNITSQIVIVNPVDTDVVGSYTITYNVSDSSDNNATEVKRTVEVKDNIDPTITLFGSNSVTLEAGPTATYVDAGGRVDDNYDTTLTWASVTIDGQVNAQVPGSYTLEYSVTDGSDNDGYAMRTVHVVDTTAPVITLAGDNPMNIEAGSLNSYADPGVSEISDNVDTIAKNRVTKTGTVNVGVPGTYTVTYSVTDNANNTGSVIRTVNVTDTTAPVVTLLGNEDITVALGSSYVDAGATASDNVDGDLSAELAVESSVNTAVPGQYTVIYTVNDSASLTATATRTVTVSDQEAPEITLNGGTEVEVNINDDFSDPGGSVSDNYDTLTWNDVVVTGLEQVNTAVPGSYTVSYVVEDTTQNEAFATRIVTVIDNVKPVITVEPDEETIAQADQGTYSNQEALVGVSATDNVDQLLTIQVINPVDVTQIGDYTVRYNVFDNAGNSAVQKTKTVHVTDQTAPEIALNGSFEIWLPVGATYVDQGAIATDNVDSSVTITDNSSVVDTTVSTKTMYTIIYTATDEAGNSSTTDRFVWVDPDLNDPTLILRGGFDITVAQDSVYSDAGYQIFHPTPDNYQVKVSSNVDTSKTGVYTVRYWIGESLNPVTSVVRDVHVTDQTAPVITLNGDAIVVQEYDKNYADLGATTDEGVVPTVTHHIDTEYQGVYTVVYTAEDAAGNEAEPVIRTVIVAKRGDAHVNYGITVADAAMIRQYIAQGQMDANQLFTSDYNNDGVVNSEDIEDILAYIVGLSYLK